MEVSQGGSLKKYIQKQGKLSEQESSSIAKQILEGLSELHHLNILHKDLKSSNVLMTNSENIKLSDYALAELYDPRLLAKDGKVK